MSDGSSTTVFWSNPAPRGVSYIEGTNSASLLQAAFANSFPNWSTQAAVGALSGTLNISNHSAWVEADGSAGGDELSLQYTPGANDPPLADLHWLQVVSTNAPIGSAPSPYVDPLPGAGGQFPSDTLPFYYDINGGSLPDGPQHSGGVYNFYDKPGRPAPSVPPGGGMATTTWDATLFLTTWDGVSNTINVYDGITWGFSLSRYMPQCGSSPSQNAGGSSDRFPIGADGSPSRLQAVPEPSSALMLVVGTAVSALVYNRRIFT